MDKTKIKLLNSLKNTYCRLKPSKIDGIGIFATRDIPQGTNPFWGIKKQRWYKFKKSELAKLDQETKKMIDDFLGWEKDGTIFIPQFGLNGMDISFFLNASKKPNVKTTDYGQNFIAARKIKKGEELTVSYTSYYK